MEKHLLVTVSEQKSAMHGVRFVGDFFSDKEGTKLTLFYTASRPTQEWAGEKSHEGEREVERLARQYEKKGRMAIEEAKKLLLRVGFEEGQITSRLKVRQFSKVKDIIQEGESGLYDAVVLGRRGLSWLAEAFDESVSRGLLKEKVPFPMWFCRTPELERRNVLLCLDGSDAAFRMADHVGFILANENQHQVTLFSVRKAGRSKSEIEEVIETGRGKLLDNGVDGSLIKTGISDAGSVTKAIIKEVLEGHYAVVAAGRTGRGEGFLKNLFMGSVSDDLFQELEKSALWVCQ